MSPRLSHLKYIACLAVPLTLLWIALAIAPWDRHDWLLENVLLVAAIVLLAAT